MAVDAVSSPRVVVWDLTYACPLRCTHCYSESGRRASQQLSLDDMLTVADRLIEMKPALVNLTGGEPLLVKGDIRGRQAVHACGRPSGLVPMPLSLS